MLEPPAAPGVVAFPTPTALVHRRFTRQGFVDGLSGVTV
jgi:hypothetical protein